ncbi:hypothetical protein GCM10009739_01270 [Microbacterium ulmi]
MHPAASARAGRPSADDRSDFGREVVRREARGYGAHHQAYEETKSRKQHDSQSVLSRIHDGTVE